MDYAASILAKLPGSAARSENGLRELLAKLRNYLTPEQIETVIRAYRFAAEAHQGQRRRSGEAYISHPVAVASMLADMHMDPQAIAAAILHDVVEDTETGINDLEREFGSEIAA